jgi:hypothetical protein
MPQEEVLMALAATLVAAAQAEKARRDARWEEEGAGSDEEVSVLKYMADLYMHRYGVNKDELHVSLHSVCQAAGQTEYYVKSRSLTWWLDFCMDPVYDPVRWKKCFRMSGESFETLVELLTPFLERESTNWKQAGSPLR